MYNPQLDTFICVAETGSFARAADLLYISTPAVSQQIKLLEQSLNLKLFHRSQKGVHLTNAGKSLYRDAKQIIMTSNEAIERARKAEISNNSVRIGICELSPIWMLDDLIPRVKLNYPELDVRLVTYTCEREIKKDIINSLGKDIDVIFSMCDQGKRTPFMQVPFSMEPICCAVSKQHPLSQNERLKIDDLYDYEFLMPERGVNTHVDALRSFLERKHKQIRIKDVSFYTLDLFNHCAVDNVVMMSFEPWKGKHPMLKNIDMEWDFVIPYGFLCEENPTDSVRTFFEAVRKLYNLDPPARKA